MPSPSTFHTLGERGPRLVRRALGLPLRMLLLHLRMQGAARHLRRAPWIRQDQISETRLLRRGVKEDAAGNAGDASLGGLPLIGWQMAVFGERESGPRRFIFISPARLRWANMGKRPRSVLPSREL